MLASRDLHRVKGGDLGRREVVQSSIDVPSVEASVPSGSVLWGNFCLVKTEVLRVLQLDFSETFVVVNGTVSDELNLRDSRDRLEVEDRFFLDFVVAVTIGVALRIESLWWMKRTSLLKMHIRRFLDFHPTYLCERVLFLGGEINVPE